MAERAESGTSATCECRDAQTRRAGSRHGPGARRGSRPSNELVSHQGADHSDHAAAFRDRFWVSLALAVPVVVYSKMVQAWLGYAAPAFPGSGLVAPLLGTAIFA